MRYLLVVAALLSGACDQVFGLDERPPPDAPPVDGPPDASPMFGAEATVKLSCPTLRTPIDLSLNRNETRFVYGCTSGDSDIYEAPAVDPMTGGAPTALVATLANEGSPELSPDGRELYYVVVTTGIGQIELLQRQGLDTPWAMGTTPAWLNSPSDDRPGSPDDAGTHFVITRGTPPDSDLVELARTPFGWTEVPTMPALKAQIGPMNPQLSADGLTLVFAASGNRADLFIARRTAVVDSWLPAVPITELNTGADETDPWLSADGRRLYFTRGSVILLAQK